MPIKRLPSIWLINNMFLTGRLIYTDGLFNLHLSTGNYILSVTNASFGEIADGLLISENFKKKLKPSSCRSKVGVLLCRQKKKNRN